jgi:hypothetical protein
MDQRRGFHRGGTIDIRDNHLGAFLRKCPGDGPSNARAATGHYRHLIR